MAILKLMVLFLFMIEGYQASDYNNRLLSLHKMVPSSRNPDVKSVDLMTGAEVMETVSEAAQKFLSKGFTASASGNISTPCLAHLNLTLQALIQKQMWALEMVDATAKLPAGFFQGNILWTGSFDECVNITALVNSTTDPEPFKGRYCRIGIPLQPTNEPINIVANAIPLGDLAVDFCVPNSCDATDMKNAFNALFGMIPPTVLNTSLQAAASACQLETIDYDAKAIASIIFFSLLFTVIVIGTVYDVLIIHKLHKDTSSDLDSEETSPLIVPENVDNDTRNIRYRGYGSNDEQAGQKENGPQKVKNIQEPEHIGLLGKILQAFSVYTNGSKLLSTDTRSGMLESLNGVRFLSMSWVVLGHSYAFGAYVAKNMGTFPVTHFKRFSFMCIANATVSVDSFFLLSGLLVGYLSLRELKKVGGVKNFRWGMFYFHRFWRLTPPYMLVMFLYVPLLRYWGDGPFWPQGGTEPFCSTYWWQNLLYINNFFSFTKACMGWSWYLANDMQFYVISPLFLIPLYYSGVLGFIVCFVGLLASWIVTGVLSSYYNLPMALFGNGVDQNQGMEKYFDVYYVKPYCRLGPYIIGLMVGYLLYRTDCKVRLTKFQNLFGWLVSAGCCLSVLYANYGTVSGENVSGPEITSLYNTLHRSAWAVGVCWVIFACVTGNGGFVNSFLSWKPFIPLSRLTYLTYLIHPVVMEIYFQRKRDPIIIDDYDVVYSFLGHLVISNGAAFVLSMALESPFMGLEKALLHREKRQ